MNKLDKNYQELLQDILDNGVTKETRNGGTLSVFGRQIRHKMSEGFPLLTTKKMYFKGIVTELLWFLRGDTNIKYLVDNDCHIWDGDAIKKWMSSGKSYKFRRNLYIEPKFEILSVDEVNDEDFPYINSTGFYGFEKDGIEELWVNFSKLGKNENIQKFISDGFIYKIKTDDEFAKKWGDLGPVYGKQWRSWGTGETVTVGHNGQHTLLGEKVVDQIQNLIRDLKTNPDSRRLMVSAWNVGELESMTLPPCHYGFQMYTRELSASERATYKISKKTELFDSHEFYDFIKNNENVTIDLDEVVHKECDELNIPTRAISLMFNMRSNDVPLGLPFNLASYGLLLEILAKEVNMVPDELIASLGDAHIYVNQIDGVKEQLTREPYPLPILDIHPGILDYDMEKYPISLFEIKNYQSHPTIKMPLSN